MSKPVPTIVTLRLLAPVAPLLGLVEAIVGAGSTVNTAVPVVMLPSPLVTVTSRAPVGAAPAIVMFAVSSVALTKLVELTVIPVPEKLDASDPPLAKPAPTMLTSCPVAPWSSDEGLVEVTFRVS